MTPEQVAWVAGILEGEGCFDARQRRPTHRTTPRVRLSMTDEDVVRRFCDVVDCVYVRYVRTDPKKDGTPRKDAFTVEIKNDKALRLMLTIRPLMGARRGARIDEVITSYMTTGRQAAA